MKSIIYTFKVGINKLLVTASGKAVFPLVFPLFGKTKYGLSLMCLLLLQTSTVTESSCAEECFASDSRCKKTVQLVRVCAGSNLYW